jgi:hypothetical protein
MLVISIPSSVPWPPDESKHAGHGRPPPGTGTLIEPSQVRHGFHSTTSQSTGPRAGS